MSGESAELLKAGLIPGIPDEIAILCIARVPVQYQGPLRFVSKTWFDVFSRGEIYETRKSHSLLQKLLIICLNTVKRESSSSCSTVLPLMMYDPEPHTWQDLSPLYLWDGPGQLIDFKSVSSGPNLIVVGGIQALMREIDRNSNQPVWILRGPFGRWEIEEGVEVGKRSCAVANVVDGDLYIGGVEVTEQNIGGTVEVVWKLTLKKFDMQCTWTVIQVPSPIVPLMYWIAGSFVKDSKLHIMVRMDIHGAYFSLVFDPKEEAWEMRSSNSEASLAMAGECPFTTVQDTLFGVCWEIQGYEKIGAKIMRYDESSEAWALISRVPTEGKGKVLGYFLESVGDRLYLIESGYVDTEGGGQRVANSLYVLRLTFEENGLSGEWEVKQASFGDNSRTQRKVLSCSVVEI